VINRDGRYWHEFHEGNLLFGQVHYKGTRGKLEGSYLLAFIVTYKNLNLHLFSLISCFFSFEGKAKVALPLKSLKTMFLLCFYHFPSIAFTKNYSRAIKFAI
jgi:hypothetical protein